MNAAALATPARTWSSQQNDIFDWGRAASGHLVVRARAGTGKTTTIIEMLQYCKERNILLAAFNKSIAKELQERVKNSNVEAKTLHGLGFKFIVRYSGWGKIEVCDNGARAKGLTEAVEGDAPDVIKKLITDLHTKAREIIPYAAKGTANELIGLAVRFNIVPDDEWCDKGWDLERVCQGAHKAMRLAMQKPAGMKVEIDFADMIFLPLVNNLVRAWYDLVVVDEAQDMTEAQLDLALRSCKRGGRICVVGDDRQAIYGFRGADSGSLDRLKAKLGAKELGLTVTYRCGKKIVDLAKTLVPDYTAAEGNGEGEILKMDADKMLETAKPVDFILSRTNAPLIKVCMALLKRGVRAKVKGRDIGRGIVSLIKKFDASDVKALLPQLADWHMNECAKADEKLPEDAANERKEFVTDQRAIIEALAYDTNEIAKVIERCNDLFADDAERSSVMCSTVHRAKGLESDNVYLLEGTFFKGREEEDNIRYVAITRAKKRLIWVSGFDKQKVPGA